MAKMFYTSAEAADRLGKSEAQIKNLVRDGKLREFRDGSSVNYKVQDVDSMAPAMAMANDGSAAGASSSASGNIVLEPVEDSGVELSPSSSDIISLAETDSADTASGTTAVDKLKEDTVVPSVGVNVFDDDDDLDEHVDPLAQTAITDVAGLGIDAAGSGSGILDLTREADDTSLGQELLEEIYTDDEETEGSGLGMGDATRAGLEEAVPDTADEDAKDVEDDVAPAAASKSSRAGVTTVVEHAPDAVSAGLTALMAVAVVVMLVAGLGAAALVRGITPGLLETIYAKLWMFAAGAVVVAGIAAAVTYVLAKRSA